MQRHFGKLGGEESKLTFESFALKGLCHNAGGFALDLLSLPKSFAQLFHIMTIDYVRVPSTKKTKQKKNTFNRASHVAKNINQKREREL